MKKVKGIVFSLLAISLMVVLGACGSKASNETEKGKEGTDKLAVVTSFSIIHDIVLELGGDLVDVHSMVPIGTNPHEYEPLPEDIKKATDADLLLYSGLNLEGGEAGWFFKFMTTVKQKDENIHEIMGGVKPMYLTSEDGKEEEVNPHAFLSPKVGMIMVKNVEQALIEKDPENKATYEENAKKFLAELEDIDKEYEEKINDIPEANRILVTSEHAYQYMAADYGIKEGYLWEINTEENGTPDQIKGLISFIEKNDVKALFVESNVDKRLMETVSKETGIPIVDTIYSDELGKPGTEGETYTGFLKSNIENIHDGILSQLK